VVIQSELVKSLRIAKGDSAMAEIAEAIAVG
jgi:hypothetical protein